jgi:uncharacterized RDD family membrane protein YckC
MGSSWDDSAGIVTPEAVTLQFAEANVGSRGIAMLLDALLLGIVLGVLNTVLGSTAFATSFPSWIAITTVIVLNFLILFGYPIVFETLNHGRSPGKLAMGLRVVTVEGAPVRFRHAAIRSGFWLVDFLMTSGIAGVLATLLSKRHQRLGDMVAGTVVLRERVAGAAPISLQFRVPYGAEAYAATLDTSGLTSQDYEAVRGFLIRAYQLAPDVRGDVGRRIASALAVKLRHEPPASVGPELFLACIAARYQQRDAVGAPVATQAQQTAAGYQAPPAVPTQAPPRPADPTELGGFAPPT